MKLLVDVCLTPEWGGYLDRHNVSAVHWCSIGAAYADDRTIFEHAKAHGFVVFTHDLDFGALLAHAFA